MEDQPIRPFTLEDDIIPALNEIGRAPGGGSGVVEEMLSVASSGDVFLDTNLFMKWMKHQGKNLIGAPFALGLNQLIGLLPHGALINQWLNVGLATFDLLMSSDPTGIILNGVMAVSYTHLTLPTKRIV